LDANDTGGLAGWHCEYTTEALQRGERDVDSRNYPVPFFALSTVILA
jgi:hypothetical protein